MTPLKLNPCIRLKHLRISSFLFRGDFAALSEDQKIRAVVKSMDKIMLEVSKTFLLDALLDGSSFNPLFDPFS